METQEKLIVLSSFRQFAWITTLYNRENFHNINQSKLWRNVGTAVLYTLSLGAMILVFISAIWYCYDCDFDTKQTAMTAPIAINLLQMFWMYTAFASNNRVITQMVVDLQGVIGNRKIIDIFRCF